MKQLSGFRGVHADDRPSRSRRGVRQRATGGRGHRSRRSVGVATGDAVTAELRIIADRRAG